MNQHKKFKKLCKQLNILIYKVAFIIRIRGYKDINKYYKNINIYNLHCVCYVFFYILNVF